MGAQEVSSVKSLGVRSCNIHLAGGVTGSSLPLSHSNFEAGPHFVDKGLKHTVKICKGLEL